MSLLVVGSIALDTVKTPVEEHGDLLGGSASYAAAAASYFSPVKLVGVVGSDFPETEFDFWKSRKIDSAGVQRVEGKTFRWSGEYSWDLNTRETRSVALNVFENFKPDLPKSYRQTDFALLANIAPALQSHVLNQMEKPRFVVADTMDLWIETTRYDLDALLPDVDLDLRGVRDGIHVQAAANGADVQRRTTENCMGGSFESELLELGDGASCLVNRVHATLRHRRVRGDAARACAKP